MVGLCSCLGLGFAIVATMPAIAIVALWYAVASTASFFALWRDKRAARRGARRTPEATLHALELLGGWPGTLIAQRLLHHKRQKLKYQLALWLIIAAHVSGWAASMWISSRL
jgi:uncharacterized membrane protein YsdA (DUF1294 family)